MKDYLKLLFFTFMASALIGCAVVSNFDQNTYVGATSLKEESLAIVSKATRPATEYAEDIETLKIKLSSQLAYEKGKGKPNFISFKQWDILLSKDHDLLGGFLHKWESGKVFSKAYITEKSRQIEEGFNELLKLEGAKPK